MAKVQKLTSQTLNQRQSPELDPHKRLAAAVLAGGYQDVDDKKEAVQAKGRRFFENGRFKLWADMIHRDYDVITDGFQRVLKDGVPLGDKRRDRYRTQS